MELNKEARKEKDGMRKKDRGGREILLNEEPHTPPRREYVCYTRLPHGACPECPECCLVTAPLPRHCSLGDGRPASLSSRASAARPWAGGINTASDCRRKSWTCYLWSRGDVEPCWRGGRNGTSLILGTWKTHATGKYWGILILKSAL